MLKSTGKHSLLEEDMKTGMLHVICQVASTPTPYASDAIPSQRHIQLPCCCHHVS